MGVDIELEIFFAGSGQGEPTVNRFRFEPPQTLHDALTTLTYCVIDNVKTCDVTGAIFNEESLDGTLARIEEEARRNV